METTNVNEITELQTQIYALNEFVLREQFRVNEYLNLLAKHGLFAIEDVQAIDKIVDEKIHEIQQQQTNA